jgi:cobalt-zinc-cadmium efflux system protein
MEGTPRGTDPAQVETALAAEPGVDGVHHLHLWNLASDVPALSAHVVLVGQPTLHEAQQSADALKAMLDTRYGIAHVTLELECHGCDAPAHEESNVVPADASRLAAGEGDAGRSPTPAPVTVSGAEAGP